MAVTSLYRLQPHLLTYNVAVVFFFPSLASWGFSAAVMCDVAKTSGVGPNFTG